MRSIDVTLVSEWQDGGIRMIEDCLVAEEPLEIRVNGKPLSVTMRTPGDDLELVAGFLLTEGLISGRDRIEALHHRKNGAGRPLDNEVEAMLTGEPVRGARLKRNFLAAAGCGLCGKARIEAVCRRGLRPLDDELRIDPAALCVLPDRLRGAQTIFGHTGGLHGAGLFDAAGELVVAREDIGRHNAVDKVVGWAVLHNRLPLAGHMLLVSARGGFEIVQKAVAAGVPVLASVSAPSSLAVRLARRMGLTLVGFLRGKRFITYSGEQRLRLPSAERVEAVAP
jgi:FdhD protein